LTHRESTGGAVEGPPRWGEPHCRPFPRERREGAQSAPRKVVDHGEVSTTRSEDGPTRRGRGSSRESRQAAHDSDATTSGCCVSTSCCASCAACRSNSNARAVSSCLCTRSGVASIKAMSGRAVSRSSATATFCNVVLLGTGAPTSVAKLLRTVGHPVESCQLRLSPDQG